MSTLASVTFAFSALVAAYLLLPHFGLPMLLGRSGDADAVIYRYKLTIELEVDGEIKRGSSVVEVRNYTVAFPESAVRHGITGEALYLDLGPGRKPLIVLLAKRDQSAAFREGKAYRGWGPEQPNAILARGYNEAWPTPKKGESTDWFGFWQRLAGHRGAVELSPDQLPELVTFADVSNPKSAQVIDPGRIEVVLGPGVRWQRISIEITDEPVSSGIKERLTWLSAYSDRLLDGHRPGQLGDGSVASTLNTTYFYRGGH